MYCPSCNSFDTKVSDSRIVNNGEKVKRRRVCPECGYKFNTFEAVDNIFPRVVKSDKSREEFNPEKIHKGILRSIEKRPVNSEQIDNTLVNIKNRLINSGEKEVSSKQIGGWVLNELKKLDEVAYVRFASVYKSFQSVNDFINMVENLDKDL